MFIKRFVSLLLTLVTVAAIPITTAHAADSVAVSLPDFSVTLNGQTTSNDYSQYPLLVYRDITYFPMTYYDCRLLGLRTDWSAADGLSIERNDAGISEYIREIQSSRNSRSQRAQIASCKIQINGKVINNSQEQYPLLLFRDVTYFPLTWRFAEDEFGWEYQFDQVAGLIVSNPSAPFQNTEEWSGSSADIYGGLMGTANLKLACMFNAGTNTENHLPVAGINFYNITGENIRLLPDDCWEYRLYKIVSNKDELVYRKAIPFYHGEMPERGVVMWEINDTYWEGNFSTGDYRAVLIHPEQYQYQIQGNEQILSTPTSEYGAFSVKFSDIFTVE